MLFGTVLIDTEINKDGSLYPVRRIRQVANAAAAATAADDMADEEVIIIRGLGQYRYDASSVLTADGTWVIEPDDTIGRLLHMERDISVANGRNFVGMYGAKGDNSTDDRAAIAAADTAAGHNIFTKGTFRVNSNITISSVSVFDEGAILKPASGITITISGAIDAGQYQIFDTSLGGTISITGKTVYAYPEWFGAAGDGSTDDQSALEETISSASAIRLASGKTYLIDSQVSVAGNRTILGYGAYLQIGTAGINGFYLNGVERVRIEGIEFVGTATTSINERLIYIKDAEFGSQIRVTKCKISQATYGIQIENCKDVEVDHNLFESIVGLAGQSEGYGTLVTTDSEVCFIHHNIYRTIARHAIYLSSGTSRCIVSENHVDGCVLAAISLYSTSAQNPCQYNLIANNHVQNVTGAQGYGVELSVYVLYNIVVGNTIEDISVYGIYLNGPTVEAFNPDYNQILRNKIRNVTEIGILLINANYCTIGYNEVLDVTNSHGIGVHSSPLAGNPGAGSDYNTLLPNVVREVGNRGVRISGVECTFTTVFYQTVTGAALDFEDLGDDTFYAYAKPAALDGNTRRWDDTAAQWVESNLLKIDPDPDPAVSTYWLQREASQRFYDENGDALWDLLFDEANGYCGWYNRDVTDPGWVLYYTRNTRQVVIPVSVDVGGGASGGYFCAGNRVVHERVAALNELTDSTTGTPGASLVAVSGSGQDTEINNNFASIATKLEAIRDALGITNGHGLTGD